MPNPAPSTRAVGRPNLEGSMRSEGLRPAGGEGLRSLAEVRAAIDAIDDQLVALLAKRLFAIRRAADLKGDPADALVEWRVDAVAARVRERAIEVGFDADAAERIWRAMMLECIEFERRTIARRQARGR